MKKFNQLSKKFQDLAKKEFKDQGLEPNMDLEINAPVENGNFDWQKGLQSFEFWYQVAIATEDRAMEEYEEPATPKAAVKPTSKPATKPKATPKTATKPKTTTKKS